MAEKTFYVGSSGPYFYDDTDYVQPETTDAEDPTYNPQNLETQDAIHTEGQIFVDTVPTKGSHVLRFSDLATMGVFHRLAHVENVDLKIATVQAIFTSDGIYAPLLLVIYANNVSVVTSHPVVGLGIAAGEDDIISPTTIVLPDNSAVWIFNLSDHVRMLTNGDVVSLGVDTNAVATAYTVDVELFGIAKAV